MAEQDVTRMWTSSPSDTFVFEIKRAPEDREPGLTLSTEALQWLVKQMTAFVGARLVYRVENGKPADRIAVTVTVNDLPE